MGKLLLVTGRLAEPEVRAAAARLDADVAVVPVSVAQFMTAAAAATSIKALETQYGQVILPGMVRFNAIELENLIKTPCFKGPSHASDLAEVVEKGLELSKKHPADNLVKKQGAGDYQNLVQKAEEKAPKFKIGELKIGHGFPPRIIAEIVDAPKLSNQEAMERAQYYLESGADIIDVGAIAAEDNSVRLREIISFLKEKLEVPISIDSLNPEEINSGIKAGADLVLSLTSENMRVVTNSPRVTYVAIPDEDNSLVQNIKQAEMLGFSKLVADPILSPPFKVAQSLSEYYEFRSMYHSQPLMMGVGNVVELIDADSVGMNALLGAVTVELGVSLLLTTENSQKTRNSVKELKRALEMCFLAKSKGSLPKDMGFDLLLAKGKDKGIEPQLNRAQLIEVSDDASRFKEDPVGYFHIHVDFDKGKIIATHTKDAQDYAFEGTSAEAVSKKIIEQNLVSDLDHAAYLGRELQKAEIFLKLKKGYVQDEDFSGL